MSAAAKERKKLAGKLRWRAVLLRKIATELDALAVEVEGSGKGDGTTPPATTGGFKSL